ncbi:hypothetical protein [Amycolatopsis thermoflava]|uniref:hypothetical protein n=1 Tax=Amycolatopsis thermoflava TaxID=84480 RepID=UPI00366846A2
MARTSVTTQPIVQTGLTPVMTEPTADGDVIDTGRVALMVTNGSGSSINVTVESPVTVDGLAVAELVVAVPAGATKFIGPFRQSTFGRPVGDPDAGRAYVNYSAQTDVDRAVISL